jgi:signal transduction histidine kinase
MNDKLRFYRRLAGFTWPRSYVGKLQLIAFVGIHLPILALVGYFGLADGSQSNNWAVLLVGLVATLVGFGLTYSLQRQLLAPVVGVTDALRGYVEQAQLPQLPVNFRDEAGLLMANTQQCITHLDNLLKFKGAILTILSHDLRVPLSTILLATELLDRQLEAETVNWAAVKQRLQTINQAARQQETLIHNTLLMVRSEMNKITISRDDRLIQEMLAEIHAETRLLAEQKAVSYDWKTDLAADVCVQLDGSKTQQILINLINNAIKFTPAGGRIELGATIQADEVTFLVRDSGLGMDAATVAALFEPFSRSNRLGTAKEAGFGLGLWICDLLVKAQAGRITVESTPGQGSCFRVHLPYQPCGERKA